jgi:hypothetical protein
MRFAQNAACIGGVRRLYLLKMKGTLMEITFNEIVPAIERLEPQKHLWQEGALADKRPLTPAERGAKLLDQAKRNSAYISWRWRQILDEMGISGEALSREELQRLYLEAGFDPNDNQFAQGIIAMREE